MLEVSCGGIVVKSYPENGLMVKLIVAGNGASDNGYTLPKGHQDPGESLEDAACREVKEEAGVQKVRIVGKVGDTTYFLKRTKNEKIVHIFLMICLEDGEPNDPDNETLRAEWLSFDNAINRMKFPAFRDFVVKARNMLAEIGYEALS